MSAPSILKTGPFTVLYQNGFLRYIRYGSLEIVRMIYFALRDENWGTYEAHIENEIIATGEDFFSVTYDCLHKKNGTPVFKWHASITAHASGEIIFEIQGNSLINLLKNRAGFCVLHPIQEIVGQPCQITHTDGTVSQSYFPKFIAPYNPFKNIGALHWKVDAHSFEMTFEGDTFETEDQRNWTDASFKTFCTPLDLPFPVELKPSDIVRQKVTFKPKAKLPVLSDRPKVQSQSHQRRKLPAIGVAASTEVEILSEEAIRLLRKLNLSHYRVEVFPFQEDWVTKLSNNCVQAKDLNLPIEVALHLSDHHSDEVEAFVMLSLQNQIKIKTIILLSENHVVTQQAVVDMVPNIKKQLPNVAIGAGTDYNFAELNRNPFDVRGLDFVSFSIHPQEHAFDDHSLFETIEAFPWVVRSAQHIYPEIPIHISSLTLRKRVNPYAASVQQRRQTNEQKNDPRQKTDFNPLWTVKSIEALAEAGAGSITLFQTVGGQGLISSDGIPYPVYHALLNLMKDNKN